MSKLLNKFSTDQNDGADDDDDIGNDGRTVDWKHNWFEDTISF